jgi:ferredoxin, 2Fe-2S
MMVRDRYRAHGADVRPGETATELIGRRGKITGVDLAGGRPSLWRERRKYLPIIAIQSSAKTIHIHESPAMPKITYVESNGIEHVVDAETGLTLMEAAVANSVPGIDAECGGACACATCHVYIDEEWASKLDPKGELESSMLEFAVGVQGTSRLSCRIPINQAMDGLRVKLPLSQI